MRHEYNVRFYTTEEACEMLHLGRTYLYYCRLAGVLQATKVGRRVLYTEEQLAAFRQKLVDDAPKIHRLIQRMLRNRKR